jgi:ArsR family transcriptional regulator, nickel/cobalt-responsive transcriptional repressor
MALELLVGQAHASNLLSKDEALADLTKALELSFFKAIADPVRQKIILILLQNGKSSIQDVTKHMMQDRSVISRHLMLLKQAGVVKQQKTNRSNEYELDGSSIIVKLEMLLNSLRLAAQQCCPLPDMSSQIKSTAEPFHLKDEPH